MRPPAPFEHRARMVRPAVAIAFLLAACTSAPRGDRAADPALLARVRAIVAELGPGVRAGVWLSPPLGEPLLSLGADEPMPVASAIKAGYLVELFAALPAKLDEPLPGAAAVLGDAGHPAVAHFSAAQRTKAQQALGTASVRRIGEVMITGKGVDNTTYNIAANLVTAWAGGPAWLDAKLHARDARWSGLRVRRYMLADRTTTGDNTATARSLAAVHGDLAARNVPGLDAATVEAVRAVLARPADTMGRRVFAKGGALDSDPVTRVEAGFREGPDGALVHVVMLERQGVPPAERAEAGQQLGAAARRIEELLLAGSR
ncbi:MAG TPA: serine hydrolase [Planctomycetota bacterium]|nr:serine hydrolase [Planctomycetota bacterium]